MAASVGYEHKSVLEPDNPVQVPDRAQRLERAYQASAPLLAKQFERRAVLDGADARVAAAKGLIVAGVGAADDVDAVAQAFRERGIRRRGEGTALIWGTVKGSQGRDRTAITTTLDIREENQLIGIARAGSRDKSSALMAKQIRAAIATFPEIDFSRTHGRAQRKIIDQLGMGGRLAVAIGVAGSGKTMLLKPLVRAWHDDGRTVYGVALAWRQSDELAEAGIAARNTRAVASFLHVLKSERIHPGRSDVVIIDELGLLGTRQLNEILAAQLKHGFQLVMLGDPLQMQSVEAGAVIALLRRALGKAKIPELESSVRQKDAEERETVLMFRNGNAEEALRRKDANGTLRIAPGGYSEAVEYIASLWEERLLANRGRPDFTISVSAPTNAQAHEISVAIRGRRKNLGEVGEDRMSVKATDQEGHAIYDVSLATGDRIRLFKRTNAKFLGTETVGNIGRNGTVLTVLDVREEGLVLRNPAGKEGLVAWNSLRDERSGKIMLAYGDALTTNTAQGTTVTEHIHAMPAGSRLVSAFGAYTSGSRHREQSFIVTSEGAERAEIIARRPLGDRREIMRSDVLNNIVRNFSQQPVKESALDMLDRAADLRRGTIRTVQASLLGMERLAARNKEPMTLRQRFADRRLNLNLETWLPWLTERLQRHAAVLGRVAASGAALADRMVKAARREDRSHRTETDYWQQEAEDVQARTMTKSNSRRQGQR